MANVFGRSIWSSINVTIKRGGGLGTWRGLLHQRSRHLNYYYYYYYCYGSLTRSFASSSSVSLESSKSSSRLRRILAAASSTEGAVAPTVHRHTNGHDLQGGSPDDEDPWHKVRSQRQAEREADDRRRQSAPVTPLMNTASQADRHQQQGRDDEQQQQQEHDEGVGNDGEEAHRWYRRERKWTTKRAIEELLLERSLVHKATSSSNLVRCTVFDYEGNVTVVSGEFKRQDLLSKHGLLPRDLRKLDTGTLTAMPSILVRNNSILINLLHIRALIKADLVILFDAYGTTDSQTQSVFMYDLEGKLRQGSRAMAGLAYEMRALEAVLISVVTALDAEMKVHTSIVAGILADLENHIDREKLRHLLVQSKALAGFIQKSTLVRDAINDVLEQDDDLAGMYLTEKLQGTVRKSEDHAEVEMLLESYYKHCDEIVQAADITMSNVRTTEEIVNIILDANRNSLMLLELKFSIGAVGLAGGALVAGLYGMNLKNFMEDSTAGFVGMTTFASAVVMIIIAIGLKHLRRVQRVTMTWDHHNAGVTSASSSSSSSSPKIMPARPVLVVTAKKPVKRRSGIFFWK
ncbi:hypothetical protein V1514DRAFT_328115 [Lipomyces japonicus]|uniref:uncharacterized protein n=1 Tax=Lipomyces japonicus TaxID=56871 RepID=UPI0034CE0084